MMATIMTRSVLVALLITLYPGYVLADEKASTWKGQLKFTLKHKRGAYCVRFSPDGRRVLTTAGDLSFRLWDLASGRELKRHQGAKAFDFIRDLAWSPNGKYAMLAAGQYKGTQRLTLWDVERWKEVTQFHGHEHPVCRVAFSPDNRSAISGGWRPNVYVWDIETGSQKKRYRPAVGQTNLLNKYEPDGNAMSLDIAPDGKRALWAGGHFNYQLRLFDLATGRPIRAYIPPPNEPSRQHIVHAQFTQDGDRILAAHSYGYLRIWDVKSGKSSPPLRISPEVITSVGYNEEETLLLAGGFNGRLTLWSIADVDKPRPSVKRLLLLQKAHPKESRVNDMGQLVAGISRVALSRDGHYAAAADHDGTVRIWKLIRDRKPAKSVK